MPYTQNWGVSRSQSPFNALIPPVEKKEEKEFVPEVNTSPDADEDIIEANNEIAKGEIRNASEIFKDEPGYNPKLKKVVSGGTMGAADWLMGGKALINIGSTAVALGPKIGAFIKGGTKLLGKKWAVHKLSKNGI